LIALIIALLINGRLGQYALNMCRIGGIAYNHSLYRA